MSGFAGKKKNLLINPVIIFLSEICYFCSVAPTSSIITESLSDGRSVFQQLLQIFWNWNS